MQRVEFSDEKGAAAARVVLKKSLGAVGQSKIDMTQKGNCLEIEIEDKNPSKKKAAQYGAKRISDMLSQIDKAIK